MLLCITSPFRWFHPACRWATPGPACVTPHTKYPSLRSSGVTAALRTLSPGRRPPPRLEEEWTVLKSLEDEGLELREPEAAEKEDLEASGSSLGPMTELMTVARERHTLPRMMVKSERT